MKDIFGVKPTAFRNSELIYNNEIANIVADMGFDAMLCEQPDKETKTENGKTLPLKTVFRPKGRKTGPRDLIVIPRYRELSGEITTRFAVLPTAAKSYAESIAALGNNTILLGYDFEHIGEHIPAKSGIFEFWQSLPNALAAHKNISIENPTAIANKLKDTQCPTLNIQSPTPTSWNDFESNALGWIGSQVQYTLFRDIERLESSARKAGGSFLNQWRYLTCSDHLYYLNEGKGSCCPVHGYFNPYGSLATATYLLTRNIDKLETSSKNFIILKKVDETPVIIISPETGRLPSAGMGQFAQYVSGKSGGLGDVVSAICKGFSDRNIPAHLITLNLRKRFKEESHLSEEEWIQSRHKLNPENIHLVSSSLFENFSSVYDGEPTLTAAEFQRQIINSYVKEIRSRYAGRAILHTHDWMAGGAIAAYARLREIPTLHTVHNTHTAHIPLHMHYGINLGKFWRHLYLSSAYGKDCVDAQATAIKNATKVSFVGKKFLTEIVQDFFLDRSIIPWSVRQETKAKYYHNAAIVIPNGISPDMYPENQQENPNFFEPGLARKFGLNDQVVQAKRENLEKFQRKVLLNVDPNAILLYWPSRLDPVQKGIEILEDIALKFVIENPDVQIAVVGNPVGNNHSHAEIMGRIACASGGKVAYQSFSDDLSLLGYAASNDVFGASLYEPFGQIDVIGNLYGSTATNRDTGGYSDKIFPLTLKSWGAPQDSGNGVLFRNYDSSGLWWALRRTVEIHRYFRNNPQDWERQAKRIMKEARQNWSLENMVAGYITAYESLNDGRPLS